MVSRRIVFMGTPEFACPGLHMLADRPDVEVALVVTQPDRPAGRGRKLQAPPVKSLADRLGLPAYQVTTLRDRETRQPIIDTQPDLIVVAAFGLILGTSILNLPPRGCVNLHASLLPRYRGASPIAAAILHGDKETGVTLMGMERGLDTGPMYAAEAVPIKASDTTGSLTDSLAAVAASLLDRNLSALLDGTISPVAQPPGATMTRQLTKADGWIDWTRPAVEIERRVRAMWPWPRAWTTVGDGLGFQVHEGEVVEGATGQRPGEVSSTPDGPVVACGDGHLLILRGQFAGRQAHGGQALSSARELASGAFLGTHGGRGDTEPLVVMAKDPG